jgi:hypothetical protein
MDQLTTFIQNIFDQPPGAYNRANQTPKGWVMYCLRDRGLLVDTMVNNADFEVRSKVGTQRFKVAQAGEELDPNVAWIVVDANGQRATVIPAQPATDAAPPT